MSKAEKENRINSLAVSFLERQQITPHPFAERIISAYKESYHQAEKDLELTWEDIRKIVIIYENVLNDKDFNTLPIKDGYTEVLKRFKAQKGE